MVKLGSRVKDRVNGFEGIVISLTQWLTGCDTVQIEGQHHEGKKQIMSTDMGQVEVLEEAAVVIGNAVVPPPAPEPALETATGYAAQRPATGIKGGPHDVLPDRGR
jgi:hypothetical protein